MFFVLCDFGLLFPYGYGYSKMASLMLVTSRYMFLTTLTPICSFKFYSGPLLSPGPLQFGPNNSRRKE